MVKKIMPEPVASTSADYSSDPESEINKPSLKRKSSSTDNDYDDDVWNRAKINSFFVNADFEASNDGCGDDDDFVILDDEDINSVLDDVEVVTASESEGEEEYESGEGVIELSSGEDVIVNEAITELKRYESESVKSVSKTNPEPELVNAVKELVQYLGIDIKVKPENSESTDDEEEAPITKLTPEELKECTSSSAAPLNPDLITCEQTEWVCQSCCKSKMTNKPSAVRGFCNNLCYHDYQLELESQGWNNAGTKRC